MDIWQPIERVVDNPIMRPTWHQSVLAPLWDWLAPPRCVGCDVLLERTTDVFCAQCGETLLPLTAPCCPLCSAPGWQARCLDCRQRPPPYARARAAFEWGGELASGLRRCKYGGRLELATALGALMAPLLERAGKGLDVVVPVPLSAAGLRRRGFNQVLELIRGARRQGARLPPIWSAVLAKPQDRPPQASLSPSERRRLPGRAFVVRRPRRLRGKTVLLVDDVMTTGATLRACAKALRRAGALRVDAVTLARAGS